MRGLLICLFCAVFLLCGCAERSGDQEKNQETGEFYEPRLAYQDWEYPVLEAEHGEDGVIEWEDKGMEARVRLWVNKPEGEIYRSDVWDIRYIDTTQFGEDIVLEQPVNGKYFRVYADFQEGKRIKGTDPEGRKDLPPIRSFHDLKNFESLQILSIDIRQTEPVEDISGVEECKNLKVLRMFGAVIPKTLEPLAKAEGLERLTLSNGTYDLSPLSGLKNLFWLGTTNCTILSLEPLEDVPLKYLDLFLDWYERGKGSTLDYKPLEKMKELRYLDVTNRLEFDLEACSFLEKLENLETLSFSGTGAESELEKVREKLPGLRLMT